jgi:hypothetical protein
MERRTPARSGDGPLMQTRDFGKVTVDGRQVLQVIGITVTCACATYRRFTVTVHYKYHSTGLGVRNGYREL